MTGFASKRAVARSLQDDIIDDLANRIKQNIDDEIMMTALGWAEFDLSEGRVYGARYHTLSPTNSKTRWNEMTEWMTDTFGPTAVDGVWTPNMRWYANNSKFWFRNPKDLTLFILRWS